MSLKYQVIRTTFSSMRLDGKVRHRDIATALGLSEGELIAAHVGSEARAAAQANSMLHATRLSTAWHAIIGNTEALGEVMALTRNAACVHEKIGVYQQISGNEHVGIVLGGEIDLRFFYDLWAHGFAVTEKIESGLQRSLQFFDAQGVAIHKIFLRPASDVLAYTALVERFTHAAQEPGLLTLPRAPVVAERLDTAIDVAGLRKGWTELRDTHNFIVLLEQFGVTRTQALRLADPQFAQQVELSSIHSLIDGAARDQVPIMVFVGNLGAIQIHSGTIHQTAHKGGWINILDPSFNLHLCAGQITSIWVVKKPTVDGLVTSMELFGADGESIAMLFGARKPGKPELKEWRQLIENACIRSASCTI